MGKRQTQFTPPAGLKAYQEKLRSPQTGSKPVDNSESKNKQTESTAQKSKNQSSGTSAPAIEESADASDEQIGKSPKTPTSNGEQSNPTDTGAKSSDEE